MRVIDQRIVLILITGLSALLGHTPASAHSDPVGDVHPSVRVENGRFVVEFYNNEDYSIDSDRNQFRMIFRPDGSLIAPRHRIKESESRYRIPLLAPEPDTRVGNERITFDLRSKQPTCLITGDGGARRRVSLPWPDDFDGSVNFSSGTATATHFALFGYRWIEKTDLDDCELFLYVFERGSSDPPAVHRLGKVATIYGPICSDVIAANGRFWVVWMHVNDDAGKVDPVLSSAGRGRGDFHSHVLDGPGHWNTHPTIAASGKRLCIAYHYGPRLETSRIVTFFEDAVAIPVKK